MEGLGGGGEKSGYEGGQSRYLTEGGRRLMQVTDGYDATIVSGVIVSRDGKATGALPGRLVRGPQGGPPQLAEAAE